MATHIPNGDNAAESVQTVGVHGVPLTATAPHAAADAGIVVIQEAFGVSDAIVAATATLAAQGYLAVAPHLYHRVADAPVTEFEAARPLMASLNGDDLRHDIADAIEYLGAAGIGAGCRGIVGFCMGGTVSLWAATSGDFAAAVTFYGGGLTKSRWKGVPPGLESGPTVRTPWLGLYGDRDRSIPSGQVEQLRTEVDSVEVPTSIVRYPDAGHAFATDPTSSRYVADAAVDAWARTVSWFDAHLR